MKNTGASITSNLSSSARELKDEYGTKILDIKQTSEATNVSEKTLRKLTTAQFSKDKVPPYLKKLRGVKAGGSRRWHVQIVADWQDEIEVESRIAIRDENPAKSGRKSKLEENKDKSAAPKRRGRPPKHLQVMGRNP